MKLIAIMASAMIAASANGQRYDADAARFERYMEQIRAVARSHGLKITKGDENAEEYFWLYCFIESPRHPMPPARAVRMAKRDWARENRLAQPE